MLRKCSLAKQEGIVFVGFERPFWEWIAVFRSRWTGYPFRLNRRGCEERLRHIGPLRETQKAIDYWPQ